MENNTNNIFSAADIMLPKFAHDSEKMSKWAIIACDQFTSEPEYWNTCREIIGGSDSTLGFILPEAYLGTPEEEAHNKTIASNSAKFSPDDMIHINGMIYLERTLPNGMIRRGIIGKLDLEAYDYSADSSSPVRATEATIIERIPPRAKIRAFAKLEFPHILVLVDDGSLFDTAKNLVEDIAYDFELMQGGGHVKAYSITGNGLDTLAEKLSEYEKDREGGVVYAMGDGNHSLAAAKANWERVKAETGDMEHPARYALCEITALTDDSLVFEPIYRLIKNCDPTDFIAEIQKITTESDGCQSVTLITAEEKLTLSFNNPDHALTVGTLQNFIDAYIKSHPEVVCDYIHGENSLEKLASEKGSVGFLFDGMEKSELFSYVEKNGTLPRKTFSMGEAESKRYYLEARVIVK